MGVGSEENAVSPGEVTESQAAQIMSALYERALDGIPKVSSSIEDLVASYLKEGVSPRQAAQQLAYYQIAKTGASGFITGLGGVITLPVTLPANITSVLYVQLRMVAAIARIGGYDLRSDQVQTMVYACLLGSSVKEILKEAGVEIGKRSLTAAIRRLPRDIVFAINRRIGFRLVTKFGEKGVINLGKLVPVAGGFISGAFDAASTHIIANNAIKNFIDEDPVQEFEAEPEVEFINEVAQEEAEDAQAIVVDAAAVGDASDAADAAVSSDAADQLDK